MIATFICAPHINQAVKIATQKITEIFTLFPLLKNELIGEGNFGKDYVKLTFKNGSIFDVVGATDTTRGGRRHAGLLDELRDHEVEEITEIVLPLLNVSRRTKAGEVNPYEPNQQIINATSAGTKQSYAYEVLIETLEDSIIDPKNAFVFGCDYRIPMMHGLLDPKFIQEMKMSSSFKDESFAREYLAQWSGGMEASYFNYDKLNKYRTIVNPEMSQKIRDPQLEFYIISVDIGRLNDQTVVTVNKVRRVDNILKSKIVNIFVLGKIPEEKHFEIQAVDLKQIIANFNPKEVVIDANGLGVGLIDYMIKENIDPRTGILYPAYGVFNTKDYDKIQSSSCQKILYILKANASTVNLIHGNCYTRINSGNVRFLIKDAEAKARLLEMKVGQKMTLEKRVQRIMPYEMTTKLFNEMANLRLKPTGNNSDIVLEQINKRYPKDKFSSLEYNLWRVKEIEEELNKTWKRKQKSRQLMFFSRGV